MATGNVARDPLTPPGAERPRRYRPKLRYELIGCGLHGHELLGIDAAAVRPQDDLFAREANGLRWYRRMRCDSWIALSPPAQPAVKYPPERENVALPLRGRPLRSRYVLRLIAVDRIIHFLVLSALAAAIFLFADNRVALNSEFTQILKDMQGGVGGPVNNTSHGLLHDLRRLFAVSTTNLYLLGTAVAAYAVLEGVEAIGLWLGKRWAEYLTFIATIVFVPYEIYELTKSISALKIVTLVVNLAIVILPGVRETAVRRARRRQSRTGRAGAGHRLAGYRAGDAAAPANPGRHGHRPSRARGHRPSRALRVRALRTALASPSLLKYTKTSFPSASHSRIRSAHHRRSVSL